MVHVCRHLSIGSEVGTQSLCFTTFKTHGPTSFHLASGDFGELTHSNFYPRQVFLSHAKLCVFHNNFFNSKTSCSLPSLNHSDSYSLYGPPSCAVQFVRCHEVSAYTGLVRTCALSTSVRFTGPIVVSQFPLVYIDQAAQIILNTAELHAVGITDRQSRLITGNANIKLTQDLSPGDLPGKIQI